MLTFLVRKLCKVPGAERTPATKPRPRQIRLVCPHPHTTMMTGPAYLENDLTVSDFSILSSEEQDAIRVNLRAAITDAPDYIEANHNQCEYESPGEFIQWRAKTTNLTRICGTSMYRSTAGNSKGEREAGGFASHRHRLGVHAPVLAGLWHRSRIRG